MAKKTFDLTSPVRNVGKNPSSSVDDLYGYYKTKEEALNATENMREKGRTVAIESEDGSVIEYWWNTDDLSDEGLTLKIPNKTGLGDLRSDANNKVTENFSLENSVNTNTKYSIDKDSHTFNGQVKVKTIDGETLAIQEEIGLISTKDYSEEEPDNDKIFAQRSYVNKEIAKVNSNFDYPSASTIIGIDKGANINAGFGIVFKDGTYKEFVIDSTIIENFNRVTGIHFDGMDLFIIYNYITNATTGSKVAAFRNFKINEQTKVYNYTVINTSDLTIDADNGINNLMHSELGKNTIAVTSKNGTAYNTKIKIGLIDKQSLRFTMLSIDGTGIGNSCQLVFNNGYYYMTVETLSITGAIYTGYPQKVYKFLENDINTLELFISRDQLASKTVLTIFGDRLYLCSSLRRTNKIIILSEYNFAGELIRTQNYNKDTEDIDVMHIVATEKYIGIIDYNGLVYKINKDNFETFTSYKIPSQTFNTFMSAVNSGGYWQVPSRTNLFQLDMLSDTDAQNSVKTLLSFSSSYASVSLWTLKYLNTYDIPEEVSRTRWQKITYNDTLELTTVEKNGTILPLYDKDKTRHYGIRNNKGNILSDNSINLKEISDLALLQFILDISFKDNQSSNDLTILLFCKKNDITDKFTIKNSLTFVMDINNYDSIQIALASSTLTDITYNGILIKIEDFRE